MDISIAENISKKAIFALFLRFRSDKKSGLPLNAIARCFLSFVCFFTVQTAKSAENCAYNKRFSNR